MTGSERPTTVGQLPTPDGNGSRVPATLTRLAWLLWVASLGVLVARWWAEGPWRLDELLVVDGLTAVMWTAVTFFSGIVHSYSRRYMAGEAGVDRFFGRVFAFTLIVMALVAAEHLLLFWGAWAAMGLVMAGLIGHARDWPQSQAAAALARRYFLAGAALLAVALVTLWWTTGTHTLRGVPAGVERASPETLAVVAGALLLAAMVQSALLPFHTWLLSSMTAPTPASALMHAGFVNAGGILLVRFAPVVTVDARFTLAVAGVGAVSAIGGKLLKTVRADVKGQLGCSTVGQMGFMILQAGLGFFAAAVAHLILHGFYKAYQFLAAGGQVAHESPGEAVPGRAWTPASVAVTVLTALAGGVTFAVLTGKGTDTDAGLVLTLLVVLTVLHAARDLATRTALPGTVRYGAVPLVALPAIAVYAGAYRVVKGLLAGLPAVGEPQTLSLGHALVAAAFVGAYIAVESGLYRRSRRLYVTLLNATTPPARTHLTATEEYDDA
jgi:NAD(P)H-quinone oxidoreductase subunit 5